MSLRTRLAIDKALRLVRHVVLFVSAVPVVAVALGGVWELVENSFETKAPPSASPPPVLIEALVWVMGSAFEAILVLILFIGAVSFVVFFCVPNAVTFPFASILARRWRDPRRFLLLRPFRRSRETRVLRRTVLDRFAVHGHVYTLADAALRVPWYRYVPFLLGQIYLFQFRQRVIRTEAQLAKLLDAVDRPYLRNLNWAASSTKVFPIACADAWWQRCVLGMLERIDIVVVDLTALRDAVLWEVEQLVARGLIDRTLFVVQATDEFHAKRWLAERVAPDARVFCYEGTAAELAELEKELTRMLARPPRAYQMTLDVTRRLAIGSLVLSYVALLAAVVAPVRYFAPGWMASWWPTAGPAVDAYLGHGDDAALRRLEVDFREEGRAALLADVQVSGFHPRRERVGADLARLAEPGDAEVIAALGRLLGTSADVEVADALRSLGGDAAGISLAALERQPRAVALLELLEHLPLAEVHAHRGDPVAVRALESASREDADWPFEPPKKRAAPLLLHVLGCRELAGALADPASEANRHREAALRIGPFDCRDIVP
jgi:hypothetical protein